MGKQGGFIKVLIPVEQSNEITCKQEILVHHR